MAYSVYSLPDIKLTFSHPKFKTNVLSNMGSGRISVSYAGDLASNTTTATGYVVINKLVAKNGSIGLEIPCNSSADNLLRNWIQHIKTSPTKEFATATMTLIDDAVGRKFEFRGVVPQKEPDEGYDATSGNRQYNLLFAEVTVTNIKKNPTAYGAKG